VCDVVAIAQVGLSAHHFLSLVLYGAAVRHRERNKKGSVVPKQNDDYLTTGPPKSRKRAKVAYEQK
jgi:hypothetical protein